MKLLTFASMIFALITPAIAHAKKPATYSCGYPRHEDRPKFKLTLDGQVQLGNEPFVKAENFKVSEDQAEFLFTQPDGKHFVGFNLKTGEGSDSVGQSPNAVYSRISCKKD